MATSLDLQEQEQLDELKAFWNKYGNAITWLLVLVLGGYAAWNGWQYYQRDQGFKAGGLYDVIEQAAQAGDAGRATAAFADLKNRYPGTPFAHQGALLAAKVQFDKGKADDARATLTWAAEQGEDADLRAVARLRLAALQAQAKQYDEALKTLDAVKSEEFAALAADRRGDVLMLQGKKADAVRAYEAAWVGMDAKVDYKRLVEAKLTALGASPGRAASAAAGADGAKPAAASAAATGATAATAVTAATAAAGASAAAVASSAVAASGSAAAAALPASGASK